MIYPATFFLFLSHFDSDTFFYIVTQEENDVTEES